ncbi:antibiotic biosynthesis regulator FhaB [Acrocarpospora macrocephala]|uniref:FHA domain-containing protein n=2 Tax=Acrocarpospora TaxID=90974 RepID=A0A5M3XVM5_9ACTN|nr:MULTISPECIES: FHA domain-containing protein [Acrocarpospora]GES08058.1 FHA domain-containing protein [Acrocarpospora macrocephala]GES23601.1 FHA domain-containing protein [Acrocarpospora pleiomorpha]
MSELTLLLIRLAFLAVLWFFVIAAVGVIRTDLFGPRTAPATARKPPKPAKPVSKPKRGEPRQMVVVGGPLQGTIINLTETPITIGRATDATLVLSDDYASSRHARLFPQDGQWIVEDLGSTNGTYLDRSKVTRPMPVPLGTPIRIGKTVIELRK